MTERIPLTWDEYDAFTRWRKVLYWQRGELRKIKRGYNKRVRRLGKRQAANND
jgi:hypothetical protein